MLEFNSSGNGEKLMDSVLALLILCKMCATECSIADGIASKDRESQKVEVLSLNSNCDTQSQKS